MSFSLRQIEIDRNLIGLIDRSGAFSAEVSVNDLVSLPFGLELTN